MNVVTDLKKIKKEAEKAIGSAENLKDLQDVHKKYLGKAGELTQILRSLKDMPKRERIMLGKDANDIKNALTIAFDEKSAEFKAKETKAAEEKEWIDVTAPGEKIALGHLHPLTLAKRKTLASKLITRVLKNLSGI